MNIKRTDDESHLICRCKLKIIHDGNSNGFICVSSKSSKHETLSRHLQRKTASNLRRANGCDKLNPDKAFNRRHMKRIMS